MGATTAGGGMPTTPTSSGAGTLPTSSPNPPAGPRQEAENECDDKTVAHKLRFDPFAGRNDCFILPLHFVSPTEAWCEAPQAWVGEAKLHISANGEQFVALPDEYAVLRRATNIGADADLSTWVLCHAGYAFDSTRALLLCLRCPASCLALGVSLCESGALHVQRAFTHAS